MTRVGYLGPPGTFSEEALISSPQAAESERVALPTIYETVMGVQQGLVEGAIVPIENSIEGSVDVTLDTLALDALDVEIVGESVRPIRHCLIARQDAELAALAVVVSHPQVIAQCARFLRSVAQAEVRTASSTAEAVRQVAEITDEVWAALGNRLSAQLYGCRVLREGVEDHPDNQTRFVWLARRGARAEPAAGLGRAPGASWKTSLVFWGVGATAPGWLVGCLSELSTRGVNLTRIESRPRRQGLGAYMFFADLQGAATEAGVREAIAALRPHCDELRVLGSYPAG